MLTANNPQNSTSSLSTDPSLKQAGTTASSLTNPDTNLTNRSSAASSATSTTYVSDLAWTSATNGWGSVEKNLSNGEQATGDGRTLSIRGVTYQKGLGIHANSEVTYALDGKYSNFVSDIGIDDEVGGKGAVDFQVWADGTKLFTSGVITGTSAKKTVNVDVTGKKALKLVVAAGTSTEFDHADWAGASLLSTAAPAPLPSPAPAPLPSPAPAPLPSPAPAPAPSPAPLPSTGSTTYVSDLPWTSVTNGWGPVEKNKSNGEQGAGDGRTITLNGVTYAKGLGVHANSEINYNLGGKYTKFVSDIGLDAETGGKGAVGFQVWADGTKLFDSGTITGNSATQKVSVDVTGKQALKLVVAPGNDTSSDHADWAGASLLSAAAPSPTPSPAPSPLPSINGKPVIMVPSGSKSTTQSVSLPIAGITVSDADAGNGELRVTLSAENGTLAINGNVNGGVKLGSISSNGTSSVILVGTLLQINATLADPSGLVYKSTTGFAGTDRVSIVANDNGNSGSGGAQTSSQSLSIVVNGAPTTGGGGGSTGSGGKYPNSNSPLGINLADPIDYSTEVPFADAFKTSRSWISQKEGASWGQGGQLSVNKEGWITSLQAGQYATTIVLDNGGYYPEGNYTLLYDGQGKIDVSAFSGKGLTVVSQAPGRTVVNLTAAANGAFINLRQTDASNPVRNIRFILPGQESTYQTQPFNPQFLSTLSKFKSLRFMDWEKTNGSKLANWSDRTTTGSATQAGENGVALEYMIQLANATHTDPWFTIPARATDDFVRQFATLVRDKLDPSLKAHVEYSNEVWNFGFEQAIYAKDQGVKLGLDSDQYVAGAKYYSQRSVEIFKIFENVMGGSSRLDRVLSWQSVNTYTGEKALAWKDAYKNIDSYAIAPYFDGKSALLDASKGAQIAQMSQNQVLDILQTEIRGNIKNDIVSSANLAKKYGVQLESYEGGQQLTSFQFGSYEPQITKLFSDVNRNPRMGDLYTEYLNTWKAAGGGLFSQYYDVGNFTKYGMWGALEYQGQDPKTAPKYQALINYINANPTSK